MLAIDIRPADAFPVDDAGYGFDNNGDVLSIAPMLMEKYLAAAEVASAKAILSDPVLGRLCFIHSTIAIAPAAHHIEALERETRRIHFAMAGRATGVSSMFLQLLPNGDRPADIGFHRGHWRRRRNLEAQNPLRNPFPAQHRRRSGSVGRDLQDAGLGHETAP